MVSFLHLPIKKGQKLGGNFFKPNITKRLCIYILQIKYKKKKNKRLNLRAGHWMTRKNKATPWLVDEQFVFSMFPRPHPLLFSLCSGPMAADHLSHPLHMLPLVRRACSLQAWTDATTLPGVLPERRERHGGLKWSIFWFQPTVVQHGSFFVL